MGEHTVLLTGGNRGLGLECARALVRNDPSLHLVIASRDAVRSQETVASLSGAEARIEARPLDLGSLADVRRFSDALGSDLEAGRLPPLHAAIWNSGVQFSTCRRSEDGFEATFAINHLGHYLLTHRVLRHLAAPARIVFVSSGTHDPAQTTGMPHPRYRGARALANPDDDGGDPGPAAFGRRAYTTSKLCNVMCAYELSRRLEASGLSREGEPITVNAFDPGLMPGTGLARDYPGWQKLLWFSVFHLLRVLPNVNSVAASGRALARLITDPQLSGTTRRYFEGLREIPSSRESYLEDPARELWVESAGLVGLREEETPLPIPS